MASLICPSRHNLLLHSPYIAMAVQPPCSSLAATFDVSVHMCMHGFTVSITRLQISKRCNDTGLGSSAKGKGGGSKQHRAAPGGRKQSCAAAAAGGRAGKHEGPAGCTAAAAAEPHDEPPAAAGQPPAWGPIHKQAPGLNHDAVMVGNNTLHGLGIRPIMAKAVPFPQGYFSPNLRS